MSRTVISETDSTPSIIDSASASSSLRSNAPRIRSISSSRSSGSRVSSADRRSSSVGFAGSAFSISGACDVAASAYAHSGSGIAEARASSVGLARSIRAASRVALVVVALQVQHAVDDEVREVRAQRPALRALASRRTTGTQMTMSPATGSTPGASRGASWEEPSYTNVSTFVA